MKGSKSELKMEKRKKKSEKSPKGNAPSWVEHSPKDVEALVIKLAKGGATQSMIGAILRDQYGIPDVKQITGKRIGKIIKENEAEKEIPEDLMNLIKKAVKLGKHLKVNKKDMHSKRGLELTESKIRRLSKYYKRVKRIPEDWKYDLKKAELLVK